MRFPRKRGATSVKARVFIPDNSVTTGAGCTGLTNASTNLAICYSRENDNGGTEVTGANLLDITTLGTWADPGAGKLRFKAVDATKMPGLYEIHFPDAAAFGTGDTSQNIIINVYEKTTTALKIGPNMVLIPLSLVNVLDGEANTIQVNGTAQTAGDIYGVVGHTDYGNAKLVRSTTPANTLTVDTSHRALSDLASILGTALTETAGQIAAAFKKFFNVAIPVATAESVNQTADNEGKVAIAYQVWQEALASHLDAGSAAKLLYILARDWLDGGRLDLLLDIAAGGGGATSKVYTVTSGGVPIAGVYCRMTSDIGGAVNVSTGTSNALGQVTFYHNLPAGTTVYIWRTLAGYEGADPDVEVTT